MLLSGQVCLDVPIIIILPVAAVILATIVGLIVRWYYHPNGRQRSASQEPLIKEGDIKPNGYDVLKATNRLLSAVPEAVVTVSVDTGSDGSADYKSLVEQLTHELADRDKQIERLAAEKEEFSVFLIRDLLSAQKQTEELLKEVDSLKRQLVTAKSVNADQETIEQVPPKRHSLEAQEIQKLQLNVAELNEKIRLLEQQLRAQKAPRTESPVPASAKAKTDYKSPDLSSSPPRPMLGGPSLEMAGDAIETKKREMEITKEFTRRASFSRESSQSALKWRMERGNKLDAFDKDGYLLIHRAVLEDRWDVVKHLLSIGADINSFDSRGETALHVAVRQNNSLMLDYLLVYEADPNATADSDRKTPLHLCAHHGHSKCASALIKEGADIEARSENGYTPLRVAVEQEQVDFAVWLVERYKANIDCVDDLGESILTYAVRINRASLIDFLLENGAKIDMIDGRNLTPLMVAARADNIDLIRQLSSHGAQVNAVNPDGKTALHFAASSGSAGAAQTLLELGANVDAKDALDNTPLHESCRHSHYGVSSRLVAWGADLSAKGADSLSPLALALCNNDNDTVTLLLSNGAN